MPLRKGFSFNVVQRNAQEMREAGHSRDQANAAAFALARVSFFRTHPQGALPNWLAFPRGYRLREHYDKNGKALHANQETSFNTNPSSVSAKPAKQIQDAQELYESFAGHSPAGVSKVKLKPLPKVGLVFGELIQVGYRSVRDGALYRHTFRSKSSRPLLIASSDGKQLLIVGGRYAFTDRGIEDR